MAIIHAVDDNILKCTIAQDEDVIIGGVGKIVISNDVKLPVEVIKINGKTAVIQCFEDTTGIKTGMEVVFEKNELCAMLGPGLIGEIYDGLQNPLDKIAESFGNTLPRGKIFEKLDREKEWEFKPLVTAGIKVTAGEWLGEVPEYHFIHKILVPFYIEGEYELKSIAKSGKYKIDDTIAVIEKDGNTIELKMWFLWPVKKGVPKTTYKERKKPTAPLVTGVRIIDILSPICVGGTACVPGPFGAGKTVLQHGLSKYAKVDIVIVAACGERAGEVVEVFQEFPELIDSNGHPLMNRTIIIGNTSAMPVAARESSIYLAVTFAEYYRAMGMNVLLLADSTSRWAQALREASGRLEEIPGDEAFPAYLESRIAEFYERAGDIKLKNGMKGSTTIVGTVSPAGGNFQEPVTQATLATVGAFWGLSRSRAEARKFPSIEPTESWSKYTGNSENARTKIVETLLKGKEVKEMITVVGKEGVSNEDFLNYLKAEAIDKCVLQQNAFDEVDAFCPPERQKDIEALVEKLISFVPAATKKKEMEDTVDRLMGRWIDWNYVSDKDADKYSNGKKELENIMGGVR